MTVGGGGQAPGQVGHGLGATVTGATVGAAVAGGAGVGAAVGGAKPLRMFKIELLKICGFASPGFLIAKLTTSQSAS